MIATSTLLERVARLKKPELEQAGIRLELTADPAAILHVDAQQMEQVLINLLRNAQDALAGRGDGRIELRSSHESPGRVLIHVTDNGPGIAPEHLPRLTERFYRVDIGESRAQGGTGLGLALVKHILNRHRGRLMIDSTPGSGANFSVRLPIQRTAKI